MMIRDSNQLKDKRLSDLNQVKRQTFVSIRW